MKIRRSDKKVVSKTLEHTLLTTTVCKQEQEHCKEQLVKIM